MRKHNCKVGNACERCAAEDREARVAEVIDDAINLAAVAVGLVLVALVCWVLA